MDSLFHFYATQVSNILTSGPSKRYYRIETAILVYAILRILNAFYELHYQTSQLANDPIGTLINSTSSAYEANFLIFISTLSFEIATQQMYFLKSTQISLQMMEEQAVLNWNIYQRSLKSPSALQKMKAQLTRLYLHQLEHKLPVIIYKIFHRILALLCKWKASLLIVWKGHNVNQRKMEQTRLQLFPTFSIALRMKLIKFTLIGNYYYAAFVFNHAFGNLVAAHYFLQLVLPLGPFSFLAWVHLLNDATIATIYYWIIFRNTCFYLFFIVGSSLANTSHLAEANRTLVQLSTKQKWTQGNLNCWDRRRLESFLLEHQRISRIVDLSNREFTSKMNFSVLFFNIPVSIYFTFAAAFQPLDTTTRIFYCLFIWGHFSLFAFCLLPLARTNAAFYACTKNLPNIQQILSTNQLHLKLRYDDLADRLLGGRTRIGSSIGPIKSITYQTLGQTLVLYVVYLIAMFDLLFKVFK